MGDYFFSIDFLILLFLLQNNNLQNYYFHTSYKEV